MTYIVTRNAETGTDYLSAPTMRDGRGPERVVAEDPPEGWKSPAPVGFMPPPKHRGEYRGD